MAKILDTLGKALGGLAFTKKANLRPRHEPPNVASNAKVSEIQSMIRAAEGGDPSRLFSYYRDLMLSGSHVQSESNKRKLALLGDALNILPCDKTNADDVAAAEAIKQAIEDCENWMDGLTFLLDSSLYPVSVVEHLFRPTDQPQDATREIKLRYTLKRLEPVPYALLCFRGGYENLMPKDGKSTDGKAETQAEVWEPDLRFWATNPTGGIEQNLQNSYPADPMRHMVHRGHLLIGIRDNWGGPMRCIVFWHLLAILGRDWFARLMERFGNPFIVAKADKTDKDAVTFLQDALSLATKIGGLVVDVETEVELKEAMLSGAADGYEKFLGVCNREISKIIVGQDLSAQSAPTGLGSGVANLQSGVRQDIRMFDQLKLAETLQKQLFPRFLRINGLRGNAPKARWGGLSADEAAATGALLVQLANSDLEPTDDSINVISERIGFAVQRKAAAPATPLGFGGAGLPQTFRARIATLSAQAKIADKVGVPATWLNPLQDYLAEIEAKVADESLSEQDLLNFLDRAIARVPELFKDMNVEDLAEFLAAGMGGAVLEEVRRGIKRDQN